MSADVQFVTLMPSSTGPGHLVYWGTTLIGGVGPSATEPGKWAAWASAGTMPVRTDFRDQAAAVRWVRLCARPVVWTVRRTNDGTWPWSVTDHGGVVHDTYRDHRYAVRAADARARRAAAAL